MTKLATAGMSSCATMAISGFKDDDRALNETYKKSKEWKSTTEKTVNWFRNNVLYPTAQKLGETEHYPFRRLMEEIDNSDLSSKAIYVALPVFQLTDGYWVKELEEFGFKPLHKTRNNWGTTNTIFARIPNLVE